MANEEIKEMAKQLASLTTAVNTLIPEVTGIRSDVAEIKSDHKLTAARIDDFKKTLYDPVNGLNTRFQAVESQQRGCPARQAKIIEQSGDSPGNRSERKGNRLTFISLICSVLFSLATLIVAIIAIIK